MQLVHPALWHWWQGGLQNSWIGNLQRVYWRQRADERERLRDPPPKVDPGAFSGQRQGWKTPKRTLWLCTASVCVAGVHSWEILELADPWNVISCLSCPTCAESAVRHQQTKPKPAISEGSFCKTCGGTKPFWSNLCTVGRLMKSQMQ